MQFVFAIVLLIAAYLITALTAKKPENAKPLSLTDLKVPQVDEGVAQSVIFGDCWSPDYQVLWYGDFYTEEIRLGGASGKGGKG